MSRSGSLPIVARAAALLALVAALSGQTPAPPAPLTLLGREGRRPLATTLVEGREMVGLDDLAAAFQLAVREDTAAGALTVSYKGKTIVLTPDQPLASVAGRLVSLPAPLTRLGRRWVVPIEFINRALTLVYDSRLELRPALRLVVVGDLRVPRVTARYERAGNELRITFEITPKTASSVTQTQDRLLIRLEADAIDATLPPPPAQGLIAGLRVVDPGTAIQLDLGPRFGSYRTSSPPADGPSVRLVIELVPNATDVSATPPAPPPAELSPLFGSPVRSAIRTIVIDPGHGGDDAGARGPAGTLEKDITLAAARRLKAAIEGRLGIRVLLTRDDDRPVDLDGRAAIANNNMADLFISLHANASVRAATKGAEILYFRLDRVAEDARRQAESQGEPLPVYGGGSREISFVQWDLAQAQHTDESAALAGIVEQRLRDRAEMTEAAVLQAPMRVLAAANMPAVLVEMGYLSNPEQEQALASSAFQNQIVQALLDAVVAFRDHLEQRAGAPAAAPPADPAAVRAR